MCMLFLRNNQFLSGVSFYFLIFGTLDLMYHEIVLIVMTHLSVDGSLPDSAEEQYIQGSLRLCLQGEIHRVRSDGTNRTEFAPAAILGSPVGLALDWISENLYYTNPSVQSIEVRDPPAKSVWLKQTQTQESDKMS